MPNEEVSAGYDVLQVVRDALTVVRPDIDSQTVQKGESLGDLGCDSMDRAEIVAISMETLGITVPIADFAHVTDINSLIDILGKQLSCPKR